MTRNRAFYLFILDKLNLNTNSVKFAGNSNFVIIGDTPVVYSIDSGNPYDMAEEDFVPNAQVINDNIPYTEDIGRTDYIKQFEFMIRQSNYENEVGALEQLKDYFDANDTHDITIGTITYRFTFKVSEPMFRASIFGHAGENWQIYSIQFGITSVDSAKAHISNDNKVEIGLTDTSYEVQATSDFQIGTKLIYDSSNKLTEVSNTSNEAIGRGVGGNAIIYYKPSNTLHTLMYKLCVGKEDRTTNLYLKTTFDGIELEYVINISDGEVQTKKGLVDTLTFSFTEV